MLRIYLKNGLIKLIILVKDLKVIDVRMKQITLFFVITILMVGRQGANIGK